MEDTRIFCLVGSCRPLMAGMGIKKTMKSVTMFMTDVRNQTISGLMQASARLGMNTAHGGRRRS